MQKLHVNNKKAGFLAAGVLVFGVLLFNSHVASGASVAEVYYRYCAQCHGGQGKGDGVNAPKMETVPSDLTNAEKLKGRSDDQIGQIIAKGGARNELSPLMPPWGHTLNRKEIDGLVRYIRKLCQCRGQ